MREPESLDEQKLQAEPPEYQPFDEDRLLDLFLQYEEGIPDV